MFEEGPHRYAIGLFNLTNLDKSEPGVVEQKNAFTIVKRGFGDRDDVIPELIYAEPGTVENVVSERFTIFPLKEDDYNLVLRMAERLAKHYPVCPDSSPSMISGKQISL